MFCLRSPSITDHTEYKNWTPLSGRLKCFEKIRMHLESIYPISKDEIKIQTGSFMNFILLTINNCYPSNTSSNSLNQFQKNIYSNYNSNEDYYNQNKEIQFSVLNFLYTENSKAKKPNSNINSLQNQIILDDDFSYKKEKEETEASLLRKSNSSLKAIRNEKISQSLKINKISDIESENINNNNLNDEITNQLYEVYESGKKAKNGININMNNKKMNSNIIVNENENEADEYYDEFDNKKNYYYANNYKNSSNPVYSKYSNYNKEINVIEEEKSKKEEEVDLDDIDEKMEYNANELLQNNIKQNNYKAYEASEDHFNEDLENEENENNINENLEDEDNQLVDDALSDLDKEEYFMKSCYDFFDYDITTLAERKVIEDSHPIRTSCFSSKGDYFAIGTNSKSIKLFHIRPVLQRFNKKNSYNFKSDFNVNNYLNQNNYDMNINNNPGNFMNNNFTDLDDIKMVFEQSNHHLGSIYCLDWSVSGRLIASGSNDRLVKLMVVPNLDESLYGKDQETLELTVHGHEGTIRSVCFEPRNDLILLSGGICKIF